MPGAIVRERESGKKSSSLEAHRRPHFIEDPTCRFIGDSYILIRDTNITIEDPYILIERLLLLQGFTVTVIISGSALYYILWGWGRVSRSPGVIAGDPQCFVIFILFHSLSASKVAKSGSKLSFFYSWPNKSLQSMTFPS